MAACLISGCTSKEELTREEASRIIKEVMKYPIVIDYDIYCSDPEAAKKTIDAGLEKEELVTVQRKMTLLFLSRMLFMNLLLPVHMKMEAT
ncbi:MAG: hypothetical protein ACR2GN_08065 [Bacteroidia bacterium]